MQTNVHMWQEVDQQLPGAWSGAGIDCKEAQGTFRGGLKTPKNVLYRDHIGILYVSFVFIVYKLFPPIKLFFKKKTTTFLLFKERDSLDDYSLGCLFSFSEPLFCSGLSVVMSF